MAQKKKLAGFVLYYECRFRDRFGKVAQLKMLPRSGVVDLEMAQGLTGDLNTLGVKWEIRNNETDVVVEKSNHTVEACDETTATN